MEELPDFDTYLNSKKIDVKQFKKGEASKYEEMKVMFAEIHPNSFTSQNLFLINPIRRKYHLKESKDKDNASPKKSMKPKFKRP